MKGRNEERERGKKEEKAQGNVRGKMRGNVRGKSERRLGDVLKRRTRYVFTASDQPSASTYVSKRVQMHRHHRRLATAITETSQPITLAA